MENNLIEYSKLISKREALKKAIDSLKEAELACRGILPGMVASITYDLDWISGILCNIEEEITGYENSKDLSDRE